MIPGKLKFLFFAVVLLSAGCRDEIIPPTDAVSNVNEIVQSRTSNSYTFVINARNISFDVTDQPGLNSNNTRLTISVDEYSSGEAEIKLISAGIVLHEDIVSNNTHGKTTNIVGANPYTIGIKCTNFTGELKILLTKIEY